MLARGIRSRIEGDKRTAIRSPKRGLRRLDGPNSGTYFKLRSGQNFGEGDNHVSGSLYYPESGGVGGIQKWGSSGRFISWMYDRPGDDRSAEGAMLFGEKEADKFENKKGIPTRARVEYVIHYDTYLVYKKQAFAVVNWTYTAHAVRAYGDKEWLRWTEDGIKADAPDFTPGFRFTSEAKMSGVARDYMSEKWYSY
jgi:hypothetical protein